MSAVLYIEGGGDNRRLAAQFREGWTRFFRRAGFGGRMPRVIRGGSRQQTFERFETHVSESRSDTVPLLLVDSEGQVAAAHSVWQHLQERDGWTQPEDAGDDQAFLMVQVMETWFVADPHALREIFGAQFAENAFRQWPQLEEVFKETVLDALEKATARCSKPYAKGKIAFELLAQIDPGLVEAALPAREESPESAESIVIVSLVHIGPAG